VPLARLLTCSPLLWGLAADRYGRRAAMAVSMTTITASGVSFGLGATGPLWAATAIRFWLGCGNGLPTLFGLICGELGGAARQSQYMSICLGAGNAATLLGPALAGLTYGSIARFPALAPSLIGCALGLAATVCTLSLIPETRPPRVRSTKDDCAPSSTARAPKPPLRQIVCTRPLPALILLRALSGLAMFCTSEVAPLWLIASRPHGGVALEKEALGLLLSGASVLSVAWLLVNGKAIAWLGLKRSLLAALLVCATALLLLPLSQVRTDLRRSRRRRIACTAKLACAWHGSVAWWRTLGGRWQMWLGGWSHVALALGGLASATQRAPLPLVALLLSAINIGLNTATVAIVSSVNNVLLAQCGVGRPNPRAGPPAAPRCCTTSTRVRARVRVLYPCACVLALRPPRQIGACCVPRRSQSTAQGRAHGDRRDGGVGW
jgi:hypothetical protein